MIIRNRTMSHIQTTQLDAKLKQKIIQICEDKIRQKGEKVGLSFYAFFANKNDDPETLMQRGGSKHISWIILRKQ